VDDFRAAWDALEPGARRALELAYDGMVAGGLPVGAALVDGAGAVVAEGRNRAYDPGGGDDVLQGTPLAHAELNVLAAVRTERDLASCTLWSSHEPCSMCAAAAGFTGVGTVRFVAPDPWATGAGVPSAGAGEPLGDPRWARVAGLLFVAGVAASVGPQSPTVRGNPGLAALLPLPAAGSLAELLEGVWSLLPSGR
jgi:tRNA(Arg) A34 adenosine deaminase TadA